MSSDEIFSEEKWNKIVEKVTPLPAIVNILLSKFDDPEVNVEEVENLISKDPILALKVLKMANSAYYGFPRSIVSIKEAILVLGLNTVRSIVLTVAMRSIMNVDASGYGFTTKKELWEHSLLVASGAKYIAKKLKYNNPEKFFIAGLLHDIGKIVLSEVMSRHKIDVIKYMVFKKMKIHEIENQIAFISHNVLGEKLGNYWNLPEFFVKVIRYHDEPFLAPEEIRKDIIVVSASNELSYKFVGSALSSLMITEIRLKTAEIYLTELGLQDTKEEILEVMSKALDISLEG